MKSLKKILVQYILPIVFFAVVIFCISYKPLLGGNTIAYNDSAYYFNVLDKDNYVKDSYSDDYFWSNLSSTIFLRKIKWEINILLKRAWFSDYIISYIFSFGILFWVAVWYFIIFSTISKNILYWYMAGIFVIFNNFTIESIAFGGFFYYWLWLISLWGLLYILYKIHTLEKIDFFDVWSIIALWAIIILPIHLVIFYIIVLSFLLYCIVNKNIKWGYLLILWLIILTGIHSYWIIPFIFNTLTVSSGETYWWNASWVLSWYSKIANYINIISFRQYFNTISAQLFPSSIVSIYYILWLVWIIYIIIKSKKNSFILFLVVLYFLFFNISLWPNSDITWWMFQFLWNNTSVFHFFRSFTRFTIVLIPIILLIYAIYVNQNWVKKSYIITVITITVLCHYPLLTWDLKWVIPKMQIPEEYQKINTFLNKYQGNKNIISYPNINYETYTWSISDYEWMRQDYYLKEYLINWNTIHNRTSLRLETKSDDFQKIFSNKVNSKLTTILAENSIDLVLLHKDAVNIFNWWIIPHEELYNYLKSNSMILIDNSYYTLFQIETPRNTITLDNGSISVNKIDSVEYRFDLQLEWKKDIIRFYRLFDKNWKIFDKNWNPIDFEHRQHNDVFNKWVIDISKLPYHSYTKNSNGTYTLELKLYYTMQDHLKLWKQISLAFIIVTLLILSTWIFRNKYNYEK